jgi:lipopolysaccharide heptosyltransferase II
MPSKPMHDLYYRSLRPAIRAVYYFCWSLLLNTIGLLIFWVRPKRLDPDKVYNIAVAKLERIGDLILSLPAVSRIKAEFSRSSITMIVSPYTRPIVDKNPDLAEVLEYAPGMSLKEKIGFIRTLRQKKFDLAIDLNTRNFSFSPAWLLFFAKAKLTLGLNNYGRGFLYNIKVRPQRLPQFYGREVMHILEPLGIKAGDFRPKLFLPDESGSFINGYLDENNINPSETAVVHPGGYYEALRWDKRKFAEAIQHLLEKHKMKVFIVGTTDEAEWAKDIVSFVSSKKRPINMVGKLSLKELMILISKSRLFIGGSSGPLHIACGFGVPTISFLGPSIPERWWPQGDNNIVFRGKLSEVSFELEYSQNKDYSELKTVTSPEVIEAIDIQLGGKKLISEHRKRILILQLGGIGDVVMSTPALKAIREKYRTSHIGLLVALRSASLVEGCPYIDELLTFDAHYAGFIEAFTLGNLLREKRVIEMLRSKNFDLIINLKRIWTWRGAIKMALFFKVIGSRYSVGRDTDGKGFFYDLKVREYTKNHRHEVEEILAVAGALGAANGQVRPEVFISGKDREYIRDFFDRQGITSQDYVIGLNPGAFRPTRRWPADNWSDLTRRLVKECGCRVIISGAKSDQAMIDDIAQRASEPVIKATNFNLRQLVALLERINLFITNDTGPMHIAAAAGTPLIALFLSGDVSKFRPYTATGRHTIIRKDLECSPCYKFQCRHNRCSKLISVDDVMLEVDKYVKS